MGTESNATSTTADADSRLVNGIIIGVAACIPVWLAVFWFVFR